MDVRKFRGAGVLMLCLLLTAAGIWNFRQGSLEVAGGISAGPVNEVDTAEAKVGLIFQVTGNGEETENVLKILRENGKKATFFVTESWGESWPELVTKIIQEGHELGLLSQEGKRWDRLSGREARSLLEQEGERLRNLRERTYALSGAGKTLWDRTFAGGSGGRSPAGGLVCGLRRLEGLRERRHF